MKHRIAFLCLLLCVTGCHGSVQPKKPASHEGKTREPQNGVEFELVGRRPLKGGISTLKFRISNKTDRPIALDSIFANDSEYPYAPYHPTYEYFTGERWVLIPTSVDNVSELYTLKPGNSVVFEDLWLGMEDLHRGTLVRLRVGKLVSKPFRW